MNNYLNNNEIKILNTIQENRILSIHFSRSLINLNKQPLFTAYDDIAIAFNDLNHRGSQHYLIISSTQKGFEENAVDNFEMKYIHYEHKPLITAKNFPGHQLDSRFCNSIDCNQIGNLKKVQIYSKDQRSRNLLLFEFDTKNKIFFIFRDHYIEIEYQSEKSVDDIFNEYFYGNKYSLLT